MVKNAHDQDLVPDQLVEYAMLAVNLATHGSSESRPDGTGPRMAAKEVERLAQAAGISVRHVFAELRSTVIVDGDKVGTRSGRKPDPSHAGRVDWR
jgi:hypothetical protein